MIPSIKFKNPPFLLSFMASFRCASCNYRFTPRGDRMPGTCPYCSERTVRPERDVFDVNDFLDEGDKQQ